MAIHEFECPKCQKVIEATFIHCNATNLTCSECGSELNRLVSRSSFRLKGKGWHSTDYPKYC